MMYFSWPLLDGSGYCEPTILVYSDEYVAECIREWRICEGLPAPSGPNMVQLYARAWFSTDVYSYGVLREWCSVDYDMNAFYHWQDAVVARKPQLLDAYSQLEERESIGDADWHPVPAEVWAANERKYHSVVHVLRQLSISPAAVSIKDADVDEIISGYSDYTARIGIGNANLRFRVALGHIPTEAEKAFFASEMQDIQRESVAHFRRTCRL